MSDAIKVATSTARGSELVTAAAAVSRMIRSTRPWDVAILLKNGKPVGVADHTFEIVRREG